MIVGDLHIMRLAVAPDEADPPLVIDPAPVLPVSIRAERDASVCSTARDFGGFAVPGRRSDTSGAPWQNKASKAMLLRPPRRPLLQRKFQILHGTCHRARTPHDAGCVGCALAGADIAPLRLPLSYPRHSVYEIGYTLVQACEILMT